MSISETSKGIRCTKFGVCGKSPDLARMQNLLIYITTWISFVTLLYLGVKNIHLGPTLPGFLSPNVAKVLVENFGIGGITNVEYDLKCLWQDKVKKSYYIW